MQYQKTDWIRKGILKKEDYAMLQEWAKSQCRCKDLNYEYIIIFFGKFRLNIIGRILILKL